MHTGRRAVLPRQLTLLLLADINKKQMGLRSLSVSASATAVSDEWVSAQFRLRPKLIVPYGSTYVYDQTTFGWPLSESTS